MRALVVTGLCFGDEGKGVVTDYLVRKHRSPLVIRYNGGPQAAHNVVTPEGVHHTFSQFGSGTLAGARTYLSPYVLVNPGMMQNEAKMLAQKGIDNPMSLMTVDQGCVVITPYHVAANREREHQRGNDRHGSVGLGIGETRADEIAGVRLTVRMLDDVAHTTSVLRRIRDRKMQEGFRLTDCGVNQVDPVMLAEHYAEWVRESGVRVIGNNQDVLKGLGWHDVLVFEGAQGVLLDERYGFAPHNSWTDCTNGNAQECILALDRTLKASDLPLLEPTQYIGVVRSYYTRHGAGPFPTEDHEDRYNRFSLDGLRKETHNGTHQYMGEFRRGHFDCSLLDYALNAAAECGGRITNLIVTHMDQYDHRSLVGVGYDLGPITKRGDTAKAFKVRPSYISDMGGPTFLKLLEERTQVPVVATFHGPTAEHCAVRAEGW